MTIDITPEAVEQLCAIYNECEQNTATTLRALSAALERSQAETAAAYEVAAKICEDQYEYLALEKNHACAVCASLIRQINPLVSRKYILDQIDYGHNIGMKKAADIVWDHDVPRPSMTDHLGITLWLKSQDILAAIPKGGE